MTCAFGIVGGAGPLVAARLQWEFLERFQRQAGVWRDEDFPGVVSVNCALEGVSERGVVNPVAAGASVRCSLESMESLGAKRWVVACASLHPHLPKDSRVLDWLGFTARHLTQRGVQRVGVVGSASSRREEVFSHALRQVNILPIELSESFQSTADALICQGMSGRIDESHRPAVEMLSSQLRSAGAQAVWWGCTELSFIPTHWLDPGDVQSVPLIVEAMLHDIPLLGPGGA